MSDIMTQGGAVTLRFPPVNGFKPALLLDYWREVATTFFWPPSNKTDAVAGVKKQRSATRATLVGTFMIRSGHHCNRLGLSCTVLLTVVGATSNPVTECSRPRSWVPGQYQGPQNALRPSDFIDFSSQCTGGSNKLFIK